MQNNLKANNVMLSSRCSVVDCRYKTLSGGLILLGIAAFHFGMSGSWLRCLPIQLPARAPWTQGIVAQVPLAIPTPALVVIWGVKQQLKDCSLTRALPFK